MSGKEGEVPAGDKFDSILEMLTKMNAELTKVKAESAEVRSLLNSNSKSAEDKEEDKKSSHNPKSKDSLEDEEDKKDWILVFSSIRRKSISESVLLG